MLFKCCVKLHKITELFLNFMKFVVILKNFYYIRKSLGSSMRNYI